MRNRRIAAVVCGAVAADGGARRLRPRRALSSISADPTAWDPIAWDSTGWASKRRGSTRRRFAGVEEAAALDFWALDSALLPGQ